MRLISMLVPIAYRSATEARQGMRPKSAACAAWSAAPVECGAVSMMASSRSGSSSSGQKGRQLGSIPHHHGGCLGATQPRPCGCGTLRIEVYQGRREPRSFAGDGQPTRKSRLPGPTLPTDECNREHDYPVLAKLARLKS